MPNLLSNSFIGTTHKRDGRPCQDFSKSCSDPAVVIVADGHGSAQHDKSHIGSQIAARLALKIIEDQSVEGEADPDFLNKLKNDFPRMMVKKWRRCIDKYEKRHKKKHLKIKNSVRSDDNSYKKYISYGTTLIVAFVFKSKLFLAQLGDGDVLVVDSEGKVKSVRQPGDHRIGDSTESLCQSDAGDAANWNIQILSFGENPEEVFEGYPTNKMVLICSDGVSNAFAKEKDFEQLASDIYGLCNEKSFGWVQKNCDEWLDLYSQTTGDDASIGIILSDADEKGIVESAPSSEVKASENLAEKIFSSDSGHRQSVAAEEPPVKESAIGEQGSEKTSDAGWISSYLLPQCWWN